VPFISFFALRLLFSHFLTSLALSSQGPISLHIRFHSVSWLSVELLFLLALLTSVTGLFSLLAQLLVSLLIFWLS